MACRPCERACGKSGNRSWRSNVPSPRGWGGLQVIVEPLVHLKKMTGKEHVAVGLCMIIAVAAILSSEP